MVLAGVSFLVEPFDGGAGRVKGPGWRKRELAVIAYRHPTASKSET